MLRGLFKSFTDGGRVDIAKRYEVLREAISGTMADFLMARDRESGEIIGLKILDKGKTEQFESRYKGLKKPSEGEIALRMDHPRIVRTFSYGITTTGQQFVVMEFLDGPGLNSLLIGRSPLLDGNRLTLVRHAAEAIHYVHQQGFIHRDICPRNFVCAKDATSLKLIDFGLTVPAEKHYMQPGNRTGTPNYMAPEIVRRRSTDLRIDVFAFGASMYELFTFELPWVRGSDGMAAMTHGSGPIEPIKSLYPAIHPVLEAAILKCLESEPQKRHSGMDAFLNMIRPLKSENEG